jgi:hypothetical protein
VVRIHWATRVAVTVSATKWLLLASALGVAKDKPADILDRIECFNWPDILQQQPTPTILGLPSSKNHSEEEWLFGSRHSTAVGVLRDDPGNDTAKKFLHQLGSCFRRVLRRVIAGQLWSQPNSTGAETIHWRIPTFFLEGMLRQPSDLSLDVSQLLDAGSFG